MPLSPQALAVLDEQRGARWAGECLRRRRRRLQRLLKGQGAAGRGRGVTGWTLHDLRRTAATRMADLGVQPHVIEAVLNHVSGHKAAWPASTTEAPMLRRSAPRSTCGARTFRRCWHRPMAQTSRSCESRLLGVWHEQRSQGERRFSGRSRTLSRDGGEAQKIPQSRPA